MTARDVSAQTDVTKLKYGKDGSFQRVTSTFRDFVEPNGKFPPEADRYHLYVSPACRTWFASEGQHDFPQRDAAKKMREKTRLTQLYEEYKYFFHTRENCFTIFLTVFPFGKTLPCPSIPFTPADTHTAWAHRTVIARELKGLKDIIPITNVSPHMGDKGWPFASVDPFPGCEPDPNIGAEHVRDLYLKADPDFSSRFTVPVLWDKKQSTIVNNESSEILRIFNSGFNSILPAEYAKVDLYPKELQKEIDEVNAWVYDTVNNGVYKSGAAVSQSAYEAACTSLFASLDRLEAMLSNRDHLVGSVLTEADIRLFTTLIRFDNVYHGLFKCNLRTIRDGYPALHLWMRKLYWNHPAFGGTTDFRFIKRHYYWSLHMINPTRIIPIGPEEEVLPL